jgi:hypothetical protein
MIPFHVRSLVVGKRNEYRNQLVKTQCDFLSVVFESISNRKHRHAPNSRLKLLRVSSFQQSFKGKTSRLAIKTASTARLCAAVYRGTSVPFICSRHSIIKPVAS